MKPIVTVSIDIALFYKRVTDIPFANRGVWVTELAESLVERDHSHPYASQLLLEAQGFKDNAANDKRIGRARKALKDAGIDEVFADTVNDPISVLKGLQDKKSPLRSPKGSCLSVCLSDCLSDCLTDFQSVERENNTDTGIQKYEESNTETLSREEAQPDGTEHGTHGHPADAPATDAAHPRGLHGCRVDGRGEGHADAGPMRTTNPEPDQADTAAQGRELTPQAQAGLVPATNRRPLGTIGDPARNPIPGMVGPGGDGVHAGDLGTPQAQTLTPAHGGPGATTSTIAPLDGAAVGSLTAKKPLQAREACAPARSTPEAGTAAHGHEAAGKRPVPAWKSREEFERTAHEAADGKYSPATVENFVAYWTEPDARGKMRWQAEKYFDMARRLATSARLGYGDAAFTPPTGAEVRAYAAEKGMPEQWANDFFGHYKSVGWMVGKVRMADWKAKLALWCNAQLKREAV